MLGTVSMEKMPISQLQLTPATQIRNVYHTQPGGFITMQPRTGHSVQCTSGFITFVRIASLSLCAYLLFNFNFEIDFCQDHR